MDAPRQTIGRARRLRKEMTLPEVLLWRELRGRAAKGRKFRRQAPFGRWILDFYCPEAKLAVEVDGWSHNMGGQADRDQRRDAWLDERGVRVLRFKAIDVLKNMGSVVDTIAAALGQLQGANGL